MALLNKANILLPKVNNLTKWCVVACDQYTSEPKYWERVASFVGDSESTLNLVYPEAFLSEGDKRIEKINATMKKYLEEGVFEEYKDALIYIERTLSGGRVRKGIIGAIDLEEYDFHKGVKCKVRATEGTVLERIPPRVKIRENAPLELPHVMLLIDDKERKLIENAKKGKKLYDFSLMENGGNLAGYLLDDADGFLKEFEKFSQNATDSLVFAVGDGNHSLATAKQCWENLKVKLSEKERENHPARFCLVEIGNIHDDVLEFEPIHRVVFGVDEKEFSKKIKEALDCKETGSQHIVMVTKEGREDLYINNITSPIEVGTLQKFLDTLDCEIDYIHGEDVVETLVREKDAVGFLLPKPDKGDLFVSVIEDGALPRKTFSMGEANEKRFYMEAKRI